MLQERSSNLKKRDRRNESLEDRSNVDWRTGGGPAGSSRWKGH